MPDRRPNMHLPLSKDLQMTWSRADHVDKLVEHGTFDVVVIGGGIVGTGIALDLSARGLSVAIVDRADFASGTSSRSSKLFHGGIRYLPQMRFGMVREGLLEQRVLTEIADYLYQPLDFVLPTYHGVGFGDMPSWLSHPALIPPAFGFGLWFYDRLGRRPKDSSERLTATEVAAMAPGLRTEGMTGGFRYRDAKTDDARLVMAVVKTAVGLGAVAVNRCAATGVRKINKGYVIELEDTMSTDKYEVATRAVVTATGAFVPPPIDGEAPALGVALSKGAHLTIETEQLSLGSEAIVLPETEDGRIIFVVPWGNHAMVGTTDTPFDGDPSHPSANDEDIDYLKRHLVRYFDIDDPNPISAWAGLRALAVDRGETTAEASRAPVIKKAAKNFYQVAGGKLTGYRAIAEEVADEVADDLDVSAKSSTEDLSLVGSGGSLADILAAARDAGLDAGYADNLYERYGHEAIAVIAKITELGLHRLHEQLEAGEVAHMVTHEAATRISDVTLRRTRVSWETRDHGRTAAPGIAAELARQLGWSDEQTAAELDAFERELVAEGL